MPSTIQSSEPAGGEVATADRSNPSRRSLLKLAGGAAIAGVGLYAAACSSSTAGENAQAASGESLLDKWTRTKTARLGVDLTFPPIQYKDANGKPAGYVMDLTQAMMADLGVTPEYVEIPFGQLFAGLIAGKFDMFGIAATILPSRALKSLFADFPLYYETAVVLKKPGSTLTSYDQLDSASIKIATLQGSSGDAIARILFPKAQFSPFAALADATNEVAVGRADAIISSEFAVASQLQAHPTLGIIHGDALYVDANAYLMPAGDYKLHSWVTNWVRYTATHQTLAGLWEKYVGSAVRGPYHLQTSAVGPSGGPMTLPAL